MDRWPRLDLGPDRILAGDGGATCLHVPDVLVERDQRPELPIPVWRVTDAARAVVKRNLQPSAAGV